MMPVYTDPYQSFRMEIIWPIVVGCIAFYAVRFIASTGNGGITKWQATMASITGVAAALVTTTIARTWDGSNVYWLAFTVGLGFAAVVMLANIVMVIRAASANDD